MRARCEPIDPLPETRGPESFHGRQRDVMTFTSTGRKGLNLLPLPIAVPIH